MQSVSLPSPVQACHFHVFERAELTVLLKRDDLIHPVISGNKYRKLKYHLLELKSQGKKGIVTFGGAFSNHLAAVAWAGKALGIPMVGWVRGQEADLQNPTLKQVQKWGMEIVPVTRETYLKKNHPHFLADIQAKYPDYLVVPEGGSGPLGIKGCTEILPEVAEHYDWVAAPLGTATTFLGLLASAPPGCKLIGFPAVEGGQYLKEEIENALWAFGEAFPENINQSKPDWHLQTGFAFGGFAKMDARLVQFMNDFWEETHIPLDPVYTGKMMFGICELAKQGFFPTGSTLLALHTGGLQGIEGMNKRLSKQGIKLNYE